MLLADTTGQRKWEFSSAGRASALQAECQRFDPVSAHHEIQHFNLVGVLFYLY